MYATYLGPEDAVVDPDGRVYEKGNPVELEDASGFASRDDFKVTKTRPHTDAREDD